MALTLETLQQYCDKSKLKPYDSLHEVFLFDGVDPYRSEGISSQFLSDARVYHERYFKPTHFGSQLYTNPVYLFRCPAFMYLSLNLPSVVSNRAPLSINPI